MQYLYMLRAGEQHYKVGISANVRSRVSGLQSHNPQKIEVITTKLVDNPYDCEQEIHSKLKAMKSGGANEWFILTPIQVIELCIKIQKYPDIDVSEKATLGEIVRQQRKLQKQIDKKLDYVINTYQKHLKKIEKPTIELVELSEPLISIEDNKDDFTIMKLAQAVILENGKASTSLLQRKLQIGYGRASRLMDKLEEQGIIGPPDGAKAREVIYSNQ